jgi:hypothetical protein
LFLLSIGVAGLEFYRKTEHARAMRGASRITDHEAPAPRQWAKPEEMYDPIAHMIDTAPVSDVCEGASAERIQREKDARDLQNRLAPLPLPATLSTPSRCGSDTVKARYEPCTLKFR